MQIFLKLRFLLFFLLGAVLLWFWDWTRAGVPRGSLPMIVPTPVTLKYILPKDHWILSHKISFVHLDKLMSKREYGLLIITPQTSEMPIEYPEYPSRFLLLGVVKGGGKYSFVLDPSKLRANARMEYVVCLDFAGNLFDQNRIGIDSSIEMMSDDPDKQVGIQ